DRGNLGAEQMQGITDQIVRDGNDTKGLRGMFSSSAANAPWLKLEIDRTKCLNLGVDVSDVFNALQIYVGSFYVNNYNQFGRTWQVNVQADPTSRADKSDLLNLQVKNNRGKMVRLSTLMEVTEEAGPVMVLR